MIGLDTMLNSFDPWMGLLVLAAYVVIDGLFALYTIHVTDLNEWKSANVSVLTHFLLAFGVISYTQNWLYIFPLAIGSWIGTFYIVRRERVKKSNQ